jgi:hypothetical protein
MKLKSLLMIFVLFLVCVSTIEPSYAFPSRYHLYCSKSDPCDREDVQYCLKQAKKHYKRDNYGYALNYGEKVVP